MEFKSRNIEQGQCEENLFASTSIWCIDFLFMRSGLQKRCWWHSVLVLVLVRGKYQTALGENWIIWELSRYNIQFQVFCRKYNFLYQLQI